VPYPKGPANLLTPGDARGLTRARRRGGKTLAAACRVLSSRVAPERLTGGILYPARANRKKIAVEFLESDVQAAHDRGSLASDEPVVSSPPIPPPPPDVPVLELKVAHFCGETIDEIQQLLCDLGEFLTVEAVDQKGTRDRESTDAERPVTDKGPPCDGLRTN
jgi:hypothetical protein